MDISVIYVNYKTSGLIKDSIRSVKKLTHGVSCELIVVDNYSEDNSLSVIEEEHPDIIGIQSMENLGFGRANNLGIEIAKGKYIFFLNPDTLLKNNAIKILYDYLETNPEVGACGGNLYDEKGYPTNSYSLSFPSITHEFLSIFYIPAYSLWHMRSRYFNHTGKPMEVASVIGADMMVRRDVLEETGAFDPAFFLNYEETELCYRIRKARHKIMSVPAAEIIHFEGRAGYIKQSRLFFLYEGQYIYFYKKNGWKAARRMYRVTQFKNNLRIFQFHILISKHKIAYWRMKRETNREAYDSFKKNNQ